MFDHDFFNPFGVFIPDQREIGYYRRTESDPSAATLTTTFKIGRRREVTESDIKIHEILAPEKTSMFSLWDSGEGVTPQPQDVLLDSRDGTRWVIFTSKTKIAGNLISCSAQREL